MAASHTGHLTGSDAVTSAVFRQFGVTRVDGLDDLLEVSAALARTRPGRPTGVGEEAAATGHLRLRDLGRHRRAHGRPGRRRRPAHPRPHEEVAAGAARRADPELPARVEPGRLRRSARRRRARPQDPRRDPRRRQHRHPHHPDHRRGRDVLRTVHARHHRRRAVDARSRSSSSGARRPAPTTRTTSGCSTAACPCSARSTTASTRCAAYQDYWTFAARYRSPFDDAPTTPSPAAKKARALLADLAPGEALSEWQSKQLLKAYGIKSSKDELVNSAAAAVRAADAIGYPVVMKVSSPDLLHKSDAGLVEGRRRFREGSARRVRRRCSPRRRRPTGSARIEGVLVSEMVTRRRRDADRRVAGPALRSGRDRRARRHLRRGVRRRDVPRPAVRRGRSAPRAARAQGLQAAARACAARSRPTSTRSSTRS